LPSQQICCRNSHHGCNRTKVPNPS
jgi:hypothetical protein